jgi:hypothetical protein
MECTGAREMALTLLGIDVPNRLPHPVRKENRSRPSTTRSALPNSLAGIDCGLFARFKLTASALLDAPFSDGGRAGTKPNGFE